MHLAILLIAASLPLLVWADARRSIDRLPQGWHFSHYPDDGEAIEFTVSLRERGVDDLRGLFWEISSPDHENYGKYLRSHELQRMVAPLESTVLAVVHWLQNHFVSDISIDRKWITFRATVAQANHLLYADFAWYRNDDANRFCIRTRSYGLPSMLEDHVSFITPTLKFPNISGLSAQPSASDRLLARSLDCSVPTTKLTEYGSRRDLCNETIFPQCLLDLYNIHYAPRSHGSRLAIGSFMATYGRYSDLAEFSSTIAPYTKGRNFTAVLLNGGVDNQTSVGPAMEANVDLQYSIGVAHPIPVLEYSTGGCSDPGTDASRNLSECRLEPWHEFIDSVLTLPDSQLPQTLSLSYGEDEWIWPEDEARELCEGFMKLGTRGVSVIVASGDSGSGAQCTNSSISNNGSEVRFVPNFPATCPYVTVVGATRHIGPEVSAPFSSGGFSNYFDRPTYQASAVQGYLTHLGSSFKGYFNASGRAYPDVAAQGVNFIIVDKGFTRPVIGTSCAAPVFAAVVALLNSALVSSGSAPLGFLNPLIYSRGLPGFNDIVDGASFGCSLDGSISQRGGKRGAGWPAAPGWDAVTGLGTPDFGKLLNIIAPSECNTGGVMPNVNPDACSGANAL